MFISVMLGALLGSFVGNTAVFFVIGLMAKRQQEAQQKELVKLQEQFLEMRQKEAERMHRYAKMES